MRALTGLVGKNPLEAQTRRDAALAVRAYGALARADAGGIFPDVTVLWLLVPAKPRCDAERHGDD